jgi:predicted nucleic acid-binding protein
VEPTGAVTVHLDTSVLVDALTGPRDSLASVERTVAAGHVLAISTLVLYEWFRGPRTDDELADQEALLPAAASREFGPSEAAAAARMYRGLKRARGRDMDIAIAACAMEHGARLWTLNPDDFRDLPGLELYQPARPGHRPER